MKYAVSLKSTVILFAAMCSIYPLVMLSCATVRHFELSRFISSDTCGGCHDAIYEQWKNSMHGLSQVDSLYRAAAFHYLKGITDPGERTEAEHCVTCHTPVGYFSGYPTSVSQERDNPGKVPGVAKQGVQCDFCHSATGAYRVYNNLITLDPGHGEADPGVKRGPYRDSQADFHKTAYSAFHDSAEVCGVCHDVRHTVFGTKLETTYEEWSKGPYNSADPAKRVTCQDCHMYQRPGFPATGSTARPANPGAAASGGPARPHVFTHYFIGGNATVPPLYGDAVKAKMAVERLVNAAALSIDASGAAEGRVRITVRNTGAGHYLPTGLTDVRQMWLEVVVKDRAGRTVYSSGVAGANGYLPPGAIVYNTVFGDAHGGVVDNVAKARQVLRDRRVPPGGSLTETITLPGGGSRAASVEARLLYMSASQELVDKLMGKGRLGVSAVTMARAKANIGGR